MSGQALAAMASHGARSPAPLVYPDPVDAKEHLLAPRRRVFEPVCNGRVENKIHWRGRQEEAAGLSRRACEHELVVNEPADGGGAPLHSEHVVVVREIDGFAAVRHVGVHALPLVPPADSERVAGLTARGQRTGRRCTRVPNDKWTALIRFAAFLPSP